MPSNLCPNKRRARGMGQRHTLKDHLFGSRPVQIGGQQRIVIASDPRKRALPRQRQQARTRRLWQPRKPLPVMECIARHHDAPRLQSSYLGRQSVERCEAIKGRQKLTRSGGVMRALFQMQIRNNQEALIKRVSRP